MVVTKKPVTLLISNGTVSIDRGFYQEQIAERCDPIALELIVRGASEMRWDVYDMDRKQWLCGTMEQLLAG